MAIKKVIIEDGIVEAADSCPVEIIKYEED